MAECADIAKKGSVNYAQQIARGANPGKASERLFATIKPHGLDDTNLIAHIIVASAWMPTTTIADRALIQKNSSSIEALRAMMQKNAGNLDKAKADRILSVPGMTSVETIKETIEKNVNTGDAVIEAEVIYAPDAVFGEDSVTLDTPIEQIVDIEADASGNFLLELKVARETAAKELKEGTSSSWNSFLTTYFDGMGAVGTEFSEWAQNHFMDRLVDYSRKTGGFLPDVNKKINDIRTEVYMNFYANVSPYNLGGSLNEQVRKDEDVKKRYFNDVLRTEFDFIIRSLIPTVTKTEGALGANQVMTSMKNFDTNAPIQNINLDLTNAADVTRPVIDTDATNTLIDEQSASLESMGYAADAMPEIAPVAVPNEFEFRTEGDTPFIVKDGTVRSFKEDLELKRNALYYMRGDETYFYRGADGTNYDVTPKPHYSYNYHANLNKSSIKDGFENPLNVGTAFINNLFPMFRFLEKDGDNLIYGKRLDGGDFTLLATHLSDIGIEKDDMSSALVKLAETKNRVGKIAATIHAHVFSISKLEMSSGDVYSLQYSANRQFKGKETGGQNINEMIVNALFSALVSKDYARFIANRGHYSEVTSPLGAYDDTARLFNSAVGGKMMTDGYTSQHIADAITIKEGSGLHFLNIVQIKINSVKTYNISKAKLNSLEVTREIAIRLDLEDIFNKINHSMMANHGSNSKSRKLVVDTMNNLFLTAAINKRQDALKLSAELKQNNKVSHPDFAKMAPSVLVWANVGELSEMIALDYTKGSTIAGSKYPAAVISNRDAKLGTMIEKYDHANVNISEGMLTSNPFLTSNDGKTGIPGAQFLGTLIKAPAYISGEGKSVDIWTDKVRAEFAIIQGALRVPQSVENSVGDTFYLQATNYADKQSIPLHGMRVKENFFLKGGAENRAKSIAVFREYQIRRYEDLQKVSISFLKDFIGADFERIATELSKDDPGGKRVKALESLRTMLLDKKYPQKGDMTRDINTKLQAVRIHPDWAKFSNSEMDGGADFITFGEESDTLYLKPHMGVRAEKYRKDTKNVMIEASLKRHAERLEKIGVSDILIKAEMRKVDMRGQKTPLFPKTFHLAKGSKKGLNIQEFYERFFLLNGIYGHAAKTLVMGDEAYFPGSYGANTRAQYYADIDSGKNDGLDELSKMMKGQFKRSQSNISRGVLYMQTETTVGYRKRFRTDNLLTHLDINSKLDGDKEVFEYYDFSGLRTKTLSELEGIGIIKRGTIAKFGDDVSATIKIGRDEVVFTTQSSYSDKYLTEMGMDEKLYTALVILLKTSPADSRADKFLTKLAVPSTSPLPDGIYPSIGGVLEIFTRKDHSVVMPDYIPSMTLTDPVSHINLLNALGDTRKSKDKHGNVTMRQENSDAVQLNHPLMMLITDYARGGKMGAFHTENNEATKTVTTTVQYDRFRQSLQKKSGQNPFSYEQMKKTSSVHMYNAFRKMNTAIPFKKQNMTLPDGTVKNIANMQELFDHFGGFGKGDGVWLDVMEALKLNPINMHAFVGYITFPSAQKTGHKKFNKFGSIFNTAENKEEINIDYTANEFNFESLTKSHEYDTTDDAINKSTVALVSQLVNAVPFSGMTDLSTRELQHSMALMAEINNLKSGEGLADFAKKRKAESPKNAADLDVLIPRFMVGNVSNDGLTDKQVALTDELMNDGLLDIAIIAYNEKLDSEVVKTIIQNRDMSLDSPAVNSKIESTLRSALFKNDIKMKQNGFIGVVSVTNKAIMSFELPNGAEVSRQGYINGMLNEAIHNNTEQAAVFTVDMSNKEELKMIDAFVLPFDEVRYRVRDSEKPFESDIRQNVNFADDSLEIKVVITPETGVFEDFDYATANDNTLINLQLEEGKEPMVAHLWYLREEYPEELDMYNEQGLITENVEEKYSLKWYQITKDKGAINITDTSAYRELYRVRRNDTTEEGKNRVKVLTTKLVLETQKKDDEGNPIWDIKKPQVVLPMFPGKAFGIPKGASLSEIFQGFVGELRIPPAKSYFKRLYRGKQFKREILKRGQKVEDLRFKYSSLVAKHNINYHKQVLDKLNTITNQDLTRLDLAAINTIIDDAKDNYFRDKAKDFIKVLDVVLARIPGQALQTAMVGTVLEFLDAQGNATHAATDHLMNTGGDMDIDTLSVITRTFTTTGLMYEIPREKGEISVKAVIQNYTDDLATISTTVLDNVEKHNELIYEKIDALENVDYAIRRNGKESGDPERVRLAERIEALTKRLIETEGVDSEATKIVKQQRNKLYKKYSGMISNAMFEAIEEALMMADNIVEVNTPISMSIFDEIIRKVSVAGTSEYRLNGEDYMSILVSEFVNAQGARSIGVFASVLKINSAVQSAFNNYNKNYRGRFKEGKNVIDNLSDAMTGQAGDYTVWYGSNTNSPDISDSVGLVFTEVQKPKSTVYGNKTYTKAHTISLGDPVVIDTAFGKSVEEAIEDAKDIIDYGGYDGIILKNVRELDGGTAVIPLRSISVMAQEELKDVQDPFKFRVTLTFHDIETDSEVNHTRTTFADLDRLGISQKMAGDGSAQGSLINILNDSTENTQEGDPRSFTEEDVETLTDILMRELYSIGDIKGSEKDTNKYIKGKAKNLFGIDTFTLEEIADKETVRAAFLNNPNLVKKAYAEIIGGLKSQNIQSQFLSAATDNAKELILGQIRSNNVTNSVITTMMVLGFDVDVTIKFLFDPMFTLIQEHYNKKFGEFDTAPLNAKDLDDIDGVSGKFKTSLIELLKIGKEIQYFQAGRSLNENFKTDQFILDKVFDGLNSAPLYRNIKNNDIYKVAKNIKTTSQRVFSADMMTFLHIQSNALFKNIYEVEKDKIARVSTVARILTRRLEKNRNNTAYKNTRSQIFRGATVSFLEAPKAGTKDYYTGTLLLQQGAKLKNTKVQLNTREGRDKFVLGFKRYFNNTLRMIELNGGEKNAALDNLGFDKSYDSKFTIVTIPALFHDATSDIKKGAIMFGIQSLKQPTGNDILDRLNLDFYNNLKMYALIVSGGEFKSNSLIHLFPEVIEEQARYLKSKKDSFFEAYIPNDPAVFGYLLGGHRFPFKETLIKDAAKSNSDLGENDGNEDSEDMSQFYGEDEDSGSGSPSYSLSSDIAYPERFSPGVSRRAYRVNTRKLAGAIYYGVAERASVYRLFDSGARESLPISKNGAPAFGIPTDLVNEWALLGKQFGYDIKYDGGTARIMNFHGNRIVNDQSVDYYTVYSAGRYKIVAGAFLMGAHNPDLLLKGNIIEDVTKANRRLFESAEISNAVIIDNVPNTLEEVKEEISVRNAVFSALFKPKVFTDNPILDIESRLLTSGLASSYIEANIKGEDDGSVAREAYRKNDGFIASDSTSDSVLIPSFVVGKMYDGYSASKTVLEMKNQISNVLNGVESGQENAIRFFGLSVGAVNNNSTERITGGGDILLEHMEEVFGAPKIRGNTYTYDGFEIERVTQYRDGRNIDTFTLVKTTKGLHISAISGKFRLGIAKDNNLNLTGADAALSMQARLQAVYKNDVIRLPHKLVTLKTGMETLTMNETDVFIIENKGTVEEKFYKLEDKFLDSQTVTVVRNEIKKSSNKTLNQDC